MVPSRSSFKTLCDATINQLSCCLQPFLKYFFGMIKVIKFRDEQLENFDTRTGKVDLVHATRPVREYLDQLDKAAGLGALPGESPQAPKSLSLTDPQAALTSKGRSKIAFAYGTNYLIDTKAAIIVDVEPSPARWTAEVAATRTIAPRNASA
jgi:hypothetical protein